ncbi:MAG TPA: VOC family virulence protein [Porticoccaceae bacterium]|nr:VOC family virulence protein [Porticoccaceae bacterium]HCO59253.1 VOC family virulence protein [Porticoccaceae bacterium]
MIKGFDHVAIPMIDVEAMVAFYRDLGFGVSDDYDGRVYAVQCGDNKINLHTPALWQSEKFTLRGPSAKPGCGDFCFVWAGSETDLHEALAKVGAEIEVGPVERIGGRNGGRDSGTSVYTRDPDRNLLEFIIYPD